MKNIKVFAVLGKSPQGLTKAETIQVKGKLFFYYY